MSSQAIHRVAIIGNHTPRRCGLATFTADLSQAVGELGIEVSVAAMNDKAGRYAYPPVVELEVDQHDRAAYAPTARHMGDGRFDVACLQHEYGIFGGQAGDFVLDLLRNLKMPLVSTLHTVLRDPTEHHRAVMDEILQLSERVVVMSERGRTILVDVHRLDPAKVDLIPHGTPVVQNGPTEPHKATLGYEGRDLILTFGLLGPDKGIEYMIQAMPSIVAKKPNALYLVLGATHPNIQEHQGEGYRQSLRKLAKSLGVQDNVLLVNRYVTLDVLLEHLLAADVYVTPYLKREQITSGTLTNAIGCGRPVVSTPYWHAEELLSGGAGILAPFRDSEALAEAVGALLTDDALREETAGKAAALGETMAWPKVGEQYLRCFESARSESKARLLTITEPARKSAVAIEPRPISLSRLEAMTDDVGLLQHATFNIPNREEGYCTDDNARALLLCASLQHWTEHNPVVERLGTAYLAFLNYALNRQKGRFRNFMGYDRSWLERAGSEDSHGRALWALGTVVGRSPQEGWREVSARLMRDGIGAATGLLSPRAWAFALLGIHEYLRGVHTDDRATSLGIELADRLHRSFMAGSDEGWRWFERTLAYDNARMPQALILAGMRWSRTEWVESGLEALEWLRGVQTGPDGVFLPIGSDGLSRWGEQRSLYDQQPVEAWASLDAYLTAWRATKRSHWKESAAAAYAWFFGENTEGLALAIPEIGSCYDGLERGSVNRNQGAESTLSFLMASVLAGEAGLQTVAAVEQAAFL